MIIIIATILFLSIVGRNLPPYATYAAMFFACVGAMLATGAPVWMITIVAILCWCMVELIISRITAREFRMLWQIGNFRLAVSMA